MNPNNQEELPSQPNNVSGDFAAFSKTVLPGSKLEINQGNEAFSTTTLPDSKMEISQAQNKPSYSTLLENRLLNLRKPETAEIPKTIPQTITEPAQTNTENLPQVGTPLFTPPENRFTPKPVENSSGNLFSLPLPAPLGIISPAEAVAKVEPLFNKTLNIPPAPIPNIPQANINPVPNQFQSPAQTIKPVTQNNIVPGPRNNASQPASKPKIEVQATEITIGDLTDKVRKSKNGSVFNAADLQGMLSGVREV